MQKREYDLHFTVVHLIFPSCDLSSGLLVMKYLAWRRCLGSLVHDLLGWPRLGCFFYFILFYLMQLPFTSLHGPDTGNRVFVHKRVFSLGVAGMRMKEYCGQVEHIQMRRRDRSWRNNIALLALVA